MPKWTPAQQNAIDATGCNILVSAAAGSGKTTVLTHRVIQMITDPDRNVDIDNLLIVTFTRSAAAEMRSRISKALSELSLKRPNDTNILRQISLLPSAKICTIDAFCSTLVRENFFYIEGLSQDFEILDDAQLRLIEETAINEIVERHYSMEDETFHTLVELLSTEKNDDNLVDVIKQIADYISAQPFPERWLYECCEHYNPEVLLKDSFFGKYVINEVKKQARAALDLIDAAYGYLFPGYELYDKYDDVLSKDRQIFESLLRAADTGWEEMRKVAFGAVFPKNVRKQKKPTIAEMAGTRDIYKTILTKDIRPLLFFSEEQIQKDNEQLYPVICKLCDIVREYGLATDAAKKELNAYSFSDVEHFAIELLYYVKGSQICKTKLAHDCEKHYAEILVDEYQDTNAAQDMLFAMLSNGKNRFMVGDVKQSIYRFRLAMPEIFNAKKDCYPLYPAGKYERNQKIILDQNFRSRKEICSFTNFVFSHLMSRDIGDLAYNSGDYLYYGANYTETDTPRVALHILTQQEGMTADEYEASQAAEFILNKLKSKQLVRDGETYRPVRFNDFAVLFRSAKARIPVWRRVFASYGIPAAANNRVNLFENNEVAVLLSLLRCVDNPSRDVPLLATLMSVFYGYTAEQIAAAKVKGKSGNLYSCILSDTEVFSDFIHDMQKYRRYAASMSVENFLRRIISDTSYLAVISGMGDGEQRRQNVMKFLHLATVFDKGESVGLTSFIRFVDNVIANGVEVDSAELATSGTGCVQLMTVHAAKGLEFPICIYAGTGHRYNNRDLSGLIQMNNRSGVGMKGYDDALMYRYPTLQYNCMKNLNVIDSMSENLRVLYVAVTRAKEEFIAFATFENPQKAVCDAAAAIVNGRITPTTVKHITGDGRLLLHCALLHPDAANLRDLTELHIDTDSSFDFRLQVVFDQELRQMDNDKEEPAPVDEALLEQIRSKLSFRYERSALSGFSAKRSASGLDEHETGMRYFASSKPAFLSESRMTSAEKGSAMHAFMQYSDYRVAKDNLEAEILRLTEEKFISREQADVLNRESLQKFFDSDIAARMLHSPRVLREYRLATLIPACDIEDTTFDDPILVQGIADCIFEEDGALVLVDYKTDRVSSEEELLLLYRKQLAFYKTAAERTLKMPVKESLLYSFSLGKECIYK